MELMLHIVVGSLVGAVAARLHLALVRRTVRTVANSGSATSVLLGLPLRVAVPGGLLFLLALWGLAPVAAGALAFAITHRLGAHAEAS